MSTPELIKETARALFKEKGYANTTIDEICAAAGVTKTTFYYHFSSKKDLQSETIFHQPPTVASANNILSKILHADSAWKQVFYLAIDALTRCDYCYDTETMKKVIADSLHTSVNFFGEIPQSHKDMMIPLLTKAQECKQIRNTTAPEDLVESLYTVFIGSVILWCTHPGGTRLDLFKGMMKAMEDLLDVDESCRFELTEKDIERVL